MLRIRFLPTRLNLREGTIALGAVQGAARGEPRRLRKVDRWQAGQCFHQRVSRANGPAGHQESQPCLHIGTGILLPIALAFLRLETFGR
jgi:hypothetical protein